MLGLEAADCGLALGCCALGTNSASVEARVHLVAAARRSGFGTREVELLTVLLTVTLLLCGQRPWVGILRLQLDCLGALRINDG